jgi:hypothetical protein
MHDAPHPGIDRDGISCPLNSFFYGFLLILSDMAAFSGRPETEKLLNQASALKEAIRGTFWDGSVFHDTVSEDGTLSEGTSWQTNSLAVYMGIPDPPSSRSAMEKMIAGYSTLCRCTPYFHYYFLPALRRCGMDGEAKELIKKEWGVMTAAGATTTWETFLGNERDSLFHLWGTAPLNYLGDPDDTGISVTLPG